MTLRKHQAETLALARRIAGGEPIRRIIASVTPGGGKSALPPILAQELLGHGFDSIMWVVPRNTLRDQGESDFASWGPARRIRAAGNQGDPFRGCDGYVTTYQGIVADPEYHRQALHGRRFILFLDEPHHVAPGGAWERALAPLVKAAGLVVFASGTFARGDGKRIAFLDYGADGLPRFPKAGLIRYTRGDALREGAVVPVSFAYLDGKTEWEEDGERRSAETLAGGDYAAQALFTALRTEYALELLDECLADWRREREVFAGAKLLVVAPNISLAGIYSAHLHRRKIENLIATSSDNAQARDNIARFKGSASVLVTVAMAYEGLSVPAVTHIACLTHIRSVPWLEQCFARANRLAQGKRFGTIYGPNDERFREAIKMISAEQEQALRERGETEGGGEGEGTGTARPWIQPISSAAIRLEGDQPEQDSNEEEPAINEHDSGLAPSQAERLLRKEIARHIEVIVGRQRAGARDVWSRVLHKELKALVGGKAREDCTVEELTAQWAELKKRWPV